MNLGIGKLGGAGAGGMGGCPFAPAATGNIATEDLAYALRRSGIPLGLELDRLPAAAALVEAELGARNPALLGRAGDFPGAPSEERSTR